MTGSGAFGDLKECNLVRGENAWGPLRGGFLGDLGDRVAAGLVRSN